MMVKEGEREGGREGGRDVHIYLVEVVHVDDGDGAEHLVQDRQLVPISLKIDCQ